MAKYVGIVERVDGTAFVVHDDKTVNLKEGVLVNDFSELITEEGSQLTFADHDGRRFYLSGSGHIRVLNKLIELKKGYMWIQSSNRTKGHSIHTVNASVNFLYGEAVVSFDNYIGKTQLLSVTGNFDFGNLLTPALSTTVSDGKFSFISDEYEDGSPRNPTSIGSKSFQQIASLFSGFNNDEKEVVTATVPIPVKETKEAVEIPKAPSRELASVDSPAKKRGKIMVVRKISPQKINPDIDLSGYYAEKLHALEKDIDKHRFKISYEKKSNVKLKVYGGDGPLVQEVHPASPVKAVEPEELKRLPSSLKTKGVGKKTASRAPASTLSSTSLEGNLNSAATAVPQANDAFEKSILNQYKQQMRHSNEVNNLINDLQNYGQDYKSDY